MDTPTPTLMPHRLTRRPRSRAEQGSCTRKRRYATEAVAMDTATRRMREDGEVILSVYPCEFCCGFHLTAHPRPGGENVAPVALVQAPADPKQLLTGRDLDEPIDWSRHQRKKQARGRSRRRREEEAEAKLAKLPEPAPATEDEVVAFFAAHGGHDEACVCCGGRAA